MPDCQNELIEAVAAVQPNTVVVLHKGSPNHALEGPGCSNTGYVLSGQAVGGAAVDILFGDVNPSGKLQNPCLTDLKTLLLSEFPGDGKKVYYSEEYLWGIVTMTAREWG